MEEALDRSGTSVLLMTALGGGSCEACYGRDAICVNLLGYPDDLLSLVPPGEPWFKC